MDVIDLRIAERLDRDSRESFANIARELGVTPRTVQRRVAHMMRGGFIRSFEVIFDPSLLGLGSAVCDVVVRSNFPIQEVRERLLKVTGVIEVLTLVGGALVTYVSYRGPADLERVLAEVSAVPAVADIRHEVAPQIGEPQWLLSKRDWRIIRALNRNARREIADVARELDFSPRTIRRRLARLVSRGVLKFGIDVDVSKAQDLFVYIVIARLQPGVPKDTISLQIRRKVQTVWREMRSVNPFIVIFSLYAESLSDMERDVEIARLVPGVAGVSVVLNTADHKSTAWVDRLVVERTT